MLVHTMKVFHTLPKMSDQDVALTIGNFDGVHRGHQTMISLLKSAAHRLNVPACVLTFEPHPREFLNPIKAPLRLTNFAEKADLLEDLGVDRIYVCRFDEYMASMPAHEFVSRLLVAQLRVRWLLVGDDFRFGARRYGDFEMLERLSHDFGFEVTSMPTVSANGERISSTAVREARERGDVGRVAALLGRYAQRGKSICTAHD